jgi:hypothetical protein
MYISLAESQANGFKKWWDAHQPGNDDDNPGGATPIAITEPALRRPRSDTGAAASSVVRARSRRIVLIL